jgi:hypothetical protein
MSVGGGTLKFERRNARDNNETVLGTLEDVMEDVEVLDDAGQVFDVFQVQITPRRVDTIDQYPNGVILATLNSHLALGPGEEQSFSLYYVEQVSGNRISGRDIIPPVISTDYKFGSVNDGTTEDLNTFLAVTMVRTGANSSDIHVKNNGAAGYLNLFQLRGLGIYPYNPYTVSVGTGGLRVQSFDMPYQNDPQIADDIANLLQAMTSGHTKPPIRVKFHANKSDGLMTAAMLGNISSRWHITETQTGINGDYFINGRKHTLSPGNRLDVEWLMVAAEVEE